MSPKGRAALSVGVSLLIALVAGWLWGSSGRYAAELALRDAQVRGALLDARSSLLSARIAFLQSNFGDAGHALAAARPEIEQARRLLQAIDRTDDAGQLTGALSAILEAEAFAGNLDPAGDERAAQAVGLLDAVLERVPPDSTSPPATP